MTLYEQALEHYNAQRSISAVYVRDDYRKPVGAAIYQIAQADYRKRYFAWWKLWRM